MPRVYSAHQSNPTTDRWRPTAWISIAWLLVLIAVFLRQTYGKALRPDGNDLTAYLLAAGAFWRGDSPYRLDTPFPFIYPLALCVVFWPLTIVPYAVAIGAWFAINVAAAASALAALARQTATRRYAMVAAGLTTVAALDIVQNNLRNGQINFVLLALSVGFWVWWSADRTLAAGLALGGAIALKITPGILLIFLLVRRDWRTLAVAIAGALILGVALPWLIAGERIVDWYRDYLTGFVAGRLRDSVSGDRLTFSLSGVIARVRGIPGAFDAPAAVAIVVAALVAADGDRTSRAPYPSAMTLSLYLIGALLITPISETHHLAFLLPALFLLIVRALEGLTNPWVVGSLATATAAVRFIPAVAFPAVLALAGVVAYEIRKPLASAGRNL